MKSAAMQMMDLFLARIQRKFDRNWTNQKVLDHMKEMHALVAAYPDIPADTPDFRLSMNFNMVEFDMGGSAWDVRGVQLRGGRLQLTAGHGHSDGMTGSDFSENPTEDVEAWLSALQTAPEAMGGPYL